MYGVGERGGISFDQNAETLASAAQGELGASAFRLGNAAATQLPREFVPLEQLCYITKGMVLHSEGPESSEGKIQFTKDDLVSELCDKTHPKRFTEGKYMVKWVVRRTLYLEYGTRRAPRLCSRPTFPQLYEVPEKLISMDLSGGEARVAYDDRQHFHNHSAWSFVPWHYLKGVQNRSIRKTTKYQREMKASEAPPRVFREELEGLSSDVEIKYLLAVMNSKFANNWLAARRRSKIHVYPDDWRALPIISIPVQRQLQFVHLVDNILGEFAKNGHPLPAKSAKRVADWEREIDQRVAALYGL